MFNAIRRIAIFFVFAAAGHANACDLLDKRICDMDAKLTAATGHSVKFVVDYSVRVAEYEWAIGQPDVIHLGDTRDLDDDSLYFALAHEFGHSVLHHGREYLESFAPADAKSLSDADLINKYGDAARNGSASEELNWRQEYQADAFAAKLLNAEGFDVPRAMNHLLQSSASSNTHPPKRSRIAKAKEAIAQAPA